MLTAPLKPGLQIYLLVKTPELNAREGVGLTKQRFAQMLRLIALAQVGLLSASWPGQMFLLGRDGCWRARLKPRLVPYAV